MSDVIKAKAFLEASVLGPLLHAADVTDITFNGEAIFYQSSLQGRKIANFTLTYEAAYQLIKQVANYMNMPFTYLDPIVDMSVAHYRIFAVGPSISRKHYQPALSFAIRIHPASGVLPIRFLTADSPWKLLFTFLIQQSVSIVIAGKTGSGKTQLQKELIQLMPAAQRVIILDNILELDGLNLSHLDMTIWQIHSSEAIQIMVNGALRSHPDWLVIAEARGKEFKEVLRSVKTGHPIITTIHSDHIDHIYHRMVSMLLIEESAVIASALYEEVKMAFPVIVYLSTTSTENGIQRTIASVWMHHQGKQWHLDATSDRLQMLAVIEQW